MTDEHGYLVVGGDSLVGTGLIRALERRGHRVLSSTRRRDTLDAKRVFLDFESDEPFRVPPGIDYVYVVAAATNYERCETDPQAYQINVVLTPRLIASLLEQDVFVTFISTNSVFGGERPWPHEDDPHAPGIAYARQKDEAEQVIRADVLRLNAADRFNTVRLTKIMDENTSPLPNWFEAWGRGEIVQPFADLIFAPMSVQFVGEALATVGEKRQPGNLHLSGAENISYVELAENLADAAGVDHKLIAPTTATEKGVVIPFKPRFSGLGMQRTTALTGVEPQKIQDVVKDLVGSHVYSQGVNSDS